MEKMGGQKLRSFFLQLSLVQEIIFKTSLKGSWRAPISATLATDTREIRR